MVIPLYCDNIWQNKLKPSTPLYDLFALYCNVYTEKKKIYMCVLVFFVGHVTRHLFRCDLSGGTLVYTTHNILHLVISENDNVTTTHHDRGS
jgi:hypothetical protein